MKKNMLLWEIYGNAYLAAFRLKLELVTFVNQDMEQDMKVMKQRFQYFVLNMLNSNITVKYLCRVHEKFHDVL